MYDPITYVAHCNTRCALKFVDAYQPDVVIFENADCTVTNGYYSCEELLSTNLPSSYDSSTDYERHECAEGVVFGYDPDITIASFNFALPEMFSGVDYGYVLDGDQVHEAMLQSDGTYLWGAQSAWLEGIDTVTLIGVGVDGSMKFTAQCSLQRL